MTDYTALREAAEKATPGPWTCTHNSWDVSSVYDKEGGPVAAVAINPDVDEDTQDKFEGQKDAIAIFIALANPTTILSLLDALSSARNDALEEAEERLDLLVRFHNRETDKLAKLKQENLKDAIMAHLHGAQAARTDGCQEAITAIRALKVKP